MGLITLAAKHAGERSAGKPLAPFDVAGAGNVTMAAGLRASAKALEHPPAPKVGAPVLDPTDERDVETGARVWLIGHRQPKGAATVMLRPTVTVPHLDSTESAKWLPDRTAATQVVATMRPIATDRNR
jgi:hypothetical protein